MLLFFAKQGFINGYFAIAQYDNKKVSMTDFGALLEF